MLKNTGRLVKLDFCLSPTLPLELIRRCTSPNLHGCITETSLRADKVQMILSPFSISLEPDSGDLPMGISVEQVKALIKYRDFDPIFGVTG